ncbi:MAG: DivIVA domain-containing protein [Myxococcota bacterium]|nr:DivIVA domain-containing protein [Myxococcota bacterium]
MARITPLDIIQKEFTPNRRGFDPDEVQGFLDQVRETLEETLKDKRRLEEKLRDRELELERMRRNEDQIKDTLVLAKKLAAEVEHNARREADVVLGEARLQAQELLSEAEDQIDDLHQELQELKGNRHRLRAELRAVLQTHQALLADMERGDSA